MPLGTSAYTIRASRTQTAFAVQTFELPRGRFAKLSGCLFILEATRPVQLSCWVKWFDRRSDTNRQWRGKYTLHKQMKKGKKKKKGRKGKWGSVQVIVWAIDSGCVIGFRDSGASGHFRGIKARRSFSPSVGTYVPKLSLRGKWNARRVAVVSLGVGSPLCPQPLMGRECDAGTPRDGASRLHAIKISVRVSIRIGRTCTHFYVVFPNTYAPHPSAIRNLPGRSRKALWKI